MSREYSLHFRRVCQLAEAAGVEKLTLLAGLPEGAPGDSAPCWVTDSYRPYSRQIYRWQWEERLIPYWIEHGKIAEDHGCVLCFEMQAADMLYNPAAVLKLREAVGPVVCCNCDTSHLMYQGIDVPEALRFLSDTVRHVHVKDVYFNAQNVRVNGLLDTTSPLEPDKRSWTFTIPGWGHSEAFWRDVITTLRFIGYEGALSVEMEAEYMDFDEGLERSFDFMKRILFEKPPGMRWWEYGGLHEMMED